MKSVFWIAVILMVTIELGAAPEGCALNLDKIKIYVLSADYKSAIAEGEKLMASSGQGYRADELYYLLGFSYLKNGNYLRASDIFEIILKEFNNSAFRDAAYLGLGDSYFLRGDYPKARDNYLKLISDCPRTKLKATVYSRLSQCAAKSGDTEEVKNYQLKLKEGFPLSPEAQMNTEIPASGNFYYTVQAGSFLSRNNANNLARKLQEKDYAAYVEELTLADKVVYRVKVGKFSNRQDALGLEDRLSREGYPTKICP